MKDSGNNVLVQVKDNQAPWRADCRTVAAPENPLDVFIAHPDSGHGRMDRRDCRVFAGAYTTDAGWAPLSAQLVQVRRRREWRDRNTRQWKHAEEVAF